jgi:tetratricopeptide (TPR) repeat protein
LARRWRWPYRHGRACLLAALLVGAAGAAGGAWYWRAGQLPAAERALRDGDFAAARVYLDRCLSWSPGDPEALCLAARLERVEGRYEAAAAHLEACQERHGVTPQVALEYSLLRAQRGDLTEEWTLLLLATPDNPQTPWILEALTRAHLNALHYAVALRLADLWVRMQPDCVRALEMRGRAKEHLRIWTKALANYARVLELDPGSLAGALSPGEPVAGKFAPGRGVAAPQHPRAEPH